MLHPTQPLICLLHSSLHILLSADGHTPSSTEAGRGSTSFHSASVRCCSSSSPGAVSGTDRIGARNSLKHRDRQRHHWPTSEGASFRAALAVALRSRGCRLSS